MIRNALKTCYNAGFEFYRCEFLHGCEHGQKPDNCAYDFSRAIADIDLVRQDCWNQGYTLFGIEAHAVFLSQNTDFDVATDDHKVTSWISTRQDKLIRPLGLEYPNGSEYPNKNCFQLRSSELGGECYIAGIMSKLKGEYRYMLGDNDLSRIGTASHTLCNEQDTDNYAHNKTWEMIGISPTRRDVYCEKEIAYEHTNIICRGHPDALFTLDDSLIIFDFKRALASVYESRARKLQLMSYGLAVEGYLGHDAFDSIYLITTKRPYPPEKEGKKRFPRYHITLATQGLKDKLSREIEERTDFQSRCVKEKSFLLSAVEAKRRSGECEKTRYGTECLSRRLCDHVVEKIEAGESIESFLMENVDLG